MRQRPSLRQSLTKLLSSRFAPWLAALAAILLTLPSLRAGWIIDDHFHRAIMHPPENSPLGYPGKLDLFRFLNGDPERSRALMDLGVLPWWTDPNIKGAFWRPVTAATHWIDYQLWPQSPVLMHLHSTLWYGAAVFVLGAFYRRLLGPTWVAGLAVLLYAVDDVHGMPVGFLANRNAMIATFFGVLTLILHERWRTRQDRRAAVGAWVMFIVSMLAGEAGLGTTAYLFAYAVFLERGTRKVRIVSLLPYALIVVAWRIAWTAQGYGVSSGMGLYVDPLTEPIAYALTALTRIPSLLAGQFAFPPADTSIMFDLDYVWVLALVAMIIMAGIFAAAYPLVRRIPRVSFWTTGMLVSTLPVSATFASDRLLWFIGIGAMALIAQFVELVWSTSRILEGSSVRLAWRHRILAKGLVILHLVLAPVTLMLRSAYPSGPQSIVDKLTVRTPFDELIRDKTLVIVNAPMVFYTAYLGTVRAMDGLPAPARIRNVASGMPSMTLERTDDRTLLVRPASGFIKQTFDRLFRSPLRPFRLGDRIKLTGLTIEITQLNQMGRPAEARFTFDVSLDDESLVWLFWSDGEFRWWKPPRVGQTVTLPCMPSLFGAFD